MDMGMMDIDNDHLTAFNQITDKKLFKRYSLMV